MGRHRLDFVAVAAAVLSLVMLVAYLWIMNQESDRAVAWFLAALILGAAAAAYGASTASPHRRSVLLVGGLVLAAVGVLAILSIGFPILVAGILCLLAAARPSGLGSAATYGQVDKT